MTWKFEDCTILRKKFGFVKALKNTLNKKAALNSCYFSSLETLVLFPGWKKNWCATGYILSMLLTDFDSFFFVCYFTQSLFQPPWKVTKRWKVAGKPRTSVFFLSKNTNRNRKYQIFLSFEDCGNFCTSNNLNFSAFRTCPSPSTRS